MSCHALTAKALYLFCTYTTAFERIEPNWRFDFAKYRKGIREIAVFESLSLRHYNMLILLALRDRNASSLYLSRPRKLGSQSLDGKHLDFDSRGGKCPPPSLFCSDSASRRSQRDRFGQLARYETCSQLTCRFQRRDAPCRPRGVERPIRRWSRRTSGAVAFF